MVDTAAHLAVKVALHVGVTKPATHAMPQLITPLESPVIRCHTELPSVLLTIESLSAVCQVPDAHAHARAHAHTCARTPPSHDEVQLASALSWVKVRA